MFGRGGSLLGDPLIEVLDRAWGNAWIPHSACAARSRPSCLAYSHHPGSALWMAGVAPAQETVTAAVVLTVTDYAPSGRGGLWAFVY